MRKSLLRKSKFGDLWARLAVFMAVIMMTGTAWADGWSLLDGIKYGYYNNSAPSATDVTSWNTFSAHTTGCIWSSNGSYDRYNGADGYFGFAFDGKYYSYTYQQDIIQVYKGVFTAPAYSRMESTWQYQLGLIRKHANYYNASSVYMFNTEAAAKSALVKHDMTLANTSGEYLKLTDNGQTVNAEKNSEAKTEDYSYDNRTGTTDHSTEVYFTYVLSCYATGGTGPQSRVLQSKLYTTNTVYNIWYYKYVTFDANGGTGDMADMTIETKGVTSGSPVMTNLNANTFTRNGYTFVGWNTKADGTGTAYADGGEIAATADSKGPVMLYAQWLNTHHCICGDEDCDGTGEGHQMIDWDPWTSTNSLPTTTGNYYLANDVTLSSTYTVAAGNDVKLCLNGHVVKNGDYNDKMIDINGTFTLTDCTETPHYFNVQSSGYRDDNPTYFLTTSPTASSVCLNGGCITGGYAWSGSPVYSPCINVNSGATFNFYAGNIVGNSSEQMCAAMKVNGTLNMYGGNVEGNYSYWGYCRLEGVANIYGGSFKNNSGGNTGLVCGGTTTIYDIEVSGNVSYENIAGLQAGGNFTMLGGTVTGNRTVGGTGGMYVGTANAVIGGDVKIYDNYCNATRSGITYSGGNIKNLQLPASTTVAVSTATPLTTGASIGVTTDTAPTDGNPVAVTSNGSASDVQHFKSDNSSYATIYKDSKVNLTVVGSNVCQIVETGTMYTTVADGISAATAGQTVQMLANYATGYMLLKGKTFTLDLNGYTLSSNGNISNIFKIQDSCNVTLDDSSEGKTGKITSNESNRARAFDVQESVLTMKAGTITTVGRNSWMGAGVHVYDGTFNMQGGAITGCKTNTYGGGVELEKGSFIMTGGTISGNTAGTFGGGVAARECADSKTITITGGSITGNTAGTVGGGVYVYSQGTTMNVGEDAIITGNKVGEAANNIYLPNGITMAISSDLTEGANICFTTVATPQIGTPVDITSNGALTDKAYFHCDNSNDSIIYEKNSATPAVSVLKLAIPVAQVGEGENAVYYSSINKVLEDVGTGETASIKLLQNTTEDVAITDENITLYLNGKTITSSGAAITINGGSLTVNDTITTADKGTVTGNIALNGGTTNLNNGKFNGEITKSGDAALNLNGGKYTSDPSQYVDLNHYVQSISESPYLYKVVDAACNDGSRGYLTVQEAIDAQTGAATITLTADTNEDITIGADKTIILDLNGHVLKGTGSGSVVTVAEGANLTIKDSGSTTTHYYTVGEDGLWTWIASPTEAQISGAKAYESLSARPATNDIVAVKGGAITGGTGTNVSGTKYYGGGVYSGGESGTLTIEGGNIIGNSCTYGGGVCTKMAVFTMTGGKMAGNVATQQGGGVYLKPSNTVSQGLTMSGGSISFNRCKTYGGGVEVGGGNSFIFNDGVIAYNYNDNSDGGGVAVDGIFKMNGGQIVGNIANNGRGGGVAFWNEFDEKVFFTGGVITGNVVNGEYSNGGGVYVGYTDTIVAGGGVQITGNTKNYGGTPVANNLYLTEDQLVTISGTTGFAEGANIGVTAATEVTVNNPVDITSNGALTDMQYFHSDNANYSVIYEKNSSSTPVLKLAIPVAQVGEGEDAVYYSSVNKALEDVGTGEAATIKLLQNTTEDVVITDENITLNLNGKTITNSSGNAITVSGGSLTINDETENIGGVTGNIALNGGTTTINNGKYNGTITKNDAATLNLVGGKYSSDPTQFLDIEHAAKLTGDDTYKYEVVSGGDEIACICDGHGFNTLQQAIDYQTKPATEAMTIQLSKDVTENVIVNGGNNIELDLNGHVFRSAEATPVENQIALVVNENGTLTVTDSKPNEVHNFKVGDNGLWTLTDETATVSYEDLTERPAAGTVVAVKGGVITRGSEYGKGVLVWGNAKFTMNGGNIGGCHCQEAGAGICAKPYSEITIGGGNIFGNVSADDGGGVFTNGKITFTSGTVSFNKANHGGGINRNHESDGDSNGGLTMTGGKIIGNLSTASNGHGGAIYLGTKYESVISGGEIKNNIGVNGGGVCLNGNGTTTISDVVISGNTATKGGGVCCLNGNLILGGSANVTGNRLTNTSTANNIYIANGRIFNFGTGTYAPTDDMLVGITTETAPTAGNDIALTGENDTDYSSRFFGDDSDYSVFYKESDKKLYFTNDVRILITADPFDAGTLTLTYADGTEITDPNHVLRGRDVTIKATPVDGYAFKGWFNTDGTMFNGRYECTFTADKSYSIEAHFTSDVIWVRIKK